MVTYNSIVFVLNSEKACKSLMNYLKQNAKSSSEVGYPLSVTIAPCKANRSNEQNARYWAILREISEQAIVRKKHYESYIWHEFLKGKFIGFDELPDGKLIPVSTTKLSIQEFSSYMDKVEAYAITELGVNFED